MGVMVRDEDRADAPTSTSANRTSAGERLINSDERYSAVAPYDSGMAIRSDLNFFGTVPMPDAGNDGPIPTERRYDLPDYVACYENLSHWAQTADEVGFNGVWFTEHHFQHEGYEVTPNLILFGLALARYTKQIRLGQMFNVVPQWHPLKLAEDFAMADILTGGRMEFGVGRGTVPREAMTLGSRVASGDNEMSAKDDSFNREQFEEAMEVIKAAWYNERFSFTGKHYQYPPTGIPDRGHTVTDLTLIPRPTRHVPIYQPVTSGETMEYVPRSRHRGVYWLMHPDLMAPRFEHFNATWEAAHDEVLRQGENKVLVLNLHVAKTREAAWKSGRNGHDEFTRFLAPYGRFTNYKGADGAKFAFGVQPSLEESVGQQIQVIDSIENAAETVRMYIDRFGIEHFCFFLDLPGLSREQMNEQIHLLGEEVLPMAGAPLTAIPLPELDHHFRGPTR
jgi:alkanesulfonate monooxygenase SsuD/methylene tetrahydromethanopterin reductase-like flavin-dependent oxidoreductase (luciferase family)